MADEESFRDYLANKGYDIEKSQDNGNTQDGVDDNNVSNVSSGGDDTTSQNTTETETTTSTETNTTSSEQNQEPQASDVDPLDTLDQINKDTTKE
jgi:hypothetical protein